MNKRQICGIDKPVPLLYSQSKVIFRLKEM